jgi:uncharacterized protein (DUF885 family)
MLADARGFERSRLDEADAITLGCLIENIDQEVRELDSRLIEHEVSAMPFAGAAVLLATAARTIISDEPAGADYLERLRHGGEWLDQQTERLRIGAGKGRLPVAPLVEQAIDWAENVLGPAVPEALAAPQPWDGSAAWLDQRDALASGVVKPALARWVEVLRELLPRARSSDEAGLVHIPGGEEDYANCVRSSTTLPLAPDEIHRIGLEEIAALPTTRRRGWMAAGQARSGSTSSDRPRVPGGISRSSRSTRACPGITCSSRVFRCSRTCPRCSASAAWRSSPRGGGSMPSSWPRRWASTAGPKACSAR